jgi:hypothetical protein
LTETLCLQAQEKFNTILETARRSKIADDDKQRKQDRDLSYRLEKRRKNNRRQHDKYREQREQSKAVNRQVESETHRKRQLFLQKLERKRAQHVDAFREQHGRLLAECQSQPYFDRLQASVTRYVERYREACGLPVAGGIFTVANPQQLSMSTGKDRESDRKVSMTDYDSEPEQSVNDTGKECLTKDEYQERDIEFVAAEIVRKALRVAGINYIKSLL